MRRAAYFVYGVGGHLLFLATYAYMAAFVGNFLVPKSIDSARTGPIGAAILIDTLLIALFGVQHSVMARPGFKRVWTRIVPKPIERSTYVYLSCFLMILLMWQWRPIGVVIWDVQNPVGRALLWGLFAFGWLMVPAVSLMINHFDLFGSRQVWMYFRGRSYTHLPFRTRMIYKHIRHPLYVGWLMTFWFTPHMTAGHLVFAIGASAYIFVAIAFEERDLLRYLGEEYRRYRETTPLMIPRLGARRQRAQSAATQTP